ncbi:hypothetical protein HY990_04860 [Candidatus Micrarchaeota archaeon]|nr:hypothetical protein [Candidatus Micrarchaeota archaeon]
MTETRMKVGRGPYREGVVVSPKERRGFVRFTPLVTEEGLNAVCVAGILISNIVGVNKLCTQRRDQAERTAIERVIQRVDCVERTSNDRFQLRIGRVSLPIDQRPRTREDLQNCQTVNVRYGDSNRDEVHCLPKEGTETQLHRLEFGSGTFQAERLRTIEVNGVNGTVELRFRRYGNGDDGVRIVRQIRICPQ